MLKVEGLEQAGTGWASPSLLVVSGLSVWASSWLGGSRPPSTSSQRAAWTLHHVFGAGFRFHTASLLPHSIGSKGVIASEGKGSRL